MKPHTLSALLLAVLLTSLPALSDSNTNWGIPVYGAQLSITLTNRIITPGTKTTVHCRVRNCSTNLITLLCPLAPPAGTFLFLTNSSRLVRNLTPESADGSYLSAPSVLPGQTYEWTVPLAIDRATPPGPYKLNATRRMFVSLNDTNNPGANLVSDTVELEVVP
jgi:hypothetical protein